MRNGFCPIGTEFKAYGTVYTDCAGERCELFVTTGLNEDGSACGRCSIRLIAEMMRGEPEVKAEAEAKPEPAELELDGSAEGQKKGK